MKYRFILFLTGIFLAVILFVFLCFNTTVPDKLFSFEIESAGGTENISCWRNDDNEFYVFVPGYTNLSDMSFLLHTETSVSINDIELENGMECDAFELNVPYELKYTDWGKSTRTTITFVRSRGIPTMYVNTQSGNMDYIHLKKGNEESGFVCLYSSDGSVNYSGEIESINGRGNSTWEMYDKKPYSFTLKSNGNLLDMGEASRWILIANADDSSNIRNKIVYDFSKSAGLDYSPDTQYVDLYLNGEYAGLYLLCERNEVAPQRVDIPQNNNSFLVSMEAEDRLESQKITYVSTRSGIALRVHYPENPSEEALMRISNIWQSFENALLSPDGTDSLTGKHWSEFIDLDSWARKYLIEEIFGNYDACALSQYFYYDGSLDNPKIYAGPVWDYDHTMGADAVWQITDPQVFLANRLEVNSGYTNKWYSTLYRTDEFYSCLKEIYQNQFRPMLDSLMDENLSDYYTQIAEASYMNQIRWNDLVSSAEKETKKIYDYMSKRIEFLDSMWIAEDEYIFVRADSSFGANYAYYAIHKGETLNNLVQFEDTEELAFDGWYYADSGEPFDASAPINQYTEIYAKWTKHSSKFEDLEKLLPIGIFAIMFAGVLFADIKRNRKGEH